MRLLVLGGTLFLGRHVVDAALAAGHDVTLFHRGRTNPGLFPDLEHVLGDRDGGLAPLRGRAFDAVVDTSGYVPRVVGDSARLLADTCGHYTFVSSLSAYALPIPRGADESAPLAVLDDPANEDVSNETYGGLKAACEDAARSAFGTERTASIRAGFIVGPHDPSDRFTYWVERVRRGGDVLLPPHPEQPMQFVDARDLAAWIVRLGETRTAGAFNATGPAGSLTFAEFAATCSLALDVSPRFVTCDERTAAALEPGDLPLAVPPEHFGLMDVSIARALAAGLRFRPAKDTIRDTAEWFRGQCRDLRTGLAQARESASVEVAEKRSDRS